MMYLKQFTNTTKCENKCFFFLYLNFEFEYKIKKMKSKYTTFWIQASLGHWMMDDQGWTLRAKITSFIFELLHVWL